MHIQTKKNSLCETKTNMTQLVSLYSVWYRGIIDSSWKDKNIMTKMNDKNSGPQSRQCIRANAPTISMLRAKRLRLAIGRE